VVEHFHPLYYRFVCFFVSLPHNIAPKRAIPPTLRTTALKLQSMKILNHYYSTSPSLRLLLPSTQKRLMTRNCWNCYWLAGPGSSIFAGIPTGNIMVKYLTQHVAYGFISCTSDFSYLCLKKANSLRICVAV